MAIKITKKNSEKSSIEYKTTKKILTPKDIKKADKLDSKLERKFKEIDNILLKKGLIDNDRIKKDPLKTWYIIGKNINHFLDHNKDLTEDDKDLFWQYLYGRSNLINKKLPTTKVSRSRNDFLTASILSRYPFRKVKDMGSWALWREIIGYSIFLNDKRILDWLNVVLKKVKTRDDARPILKLVNKRFKKIDTTVLSDRELLDILDNIKL